MRLCLKKILSFLGFFSLMPVNYSAREGQKLEDKITTKCFMTYLYNTLDLRKLFEI